MLVAAAWLHDIGYAERLDRTDFHPLDGAECLRELGEERLARVVANHGGAAEEAELGGLAVRIAAFRPESSLLSRALDYCDLTVGPDGKAMSPAERLADVEARYGAEHVVTRGMLAAWPRLERRVTEVTEQLTVGRPGGNQPR